MNPPSFVSFGSFGWTLAVETVALGSTLIIYFPPFGFDSKLKSASDMEAFSSTMSDQLERHSSVLF
jgi:hypothetical protein